MQETRCGYLRKLYECSYPTNPFYLGVAAGTPRESLKVPLKIHCECPTEIRHRQTPKTVALVIKMVLGTVKNDLLIASIGLRIFKLGLMCRQKWTVGQNSDVRGGQEIH